MTHRNRKKISSFFYLFFLIKKVAINYDFHFHHCQGLPEGKKRFFFLFLVWSTSFFFFMGWMETFFHPGRGEGGCCTLAGLCLLTFLLLRFVFVFFVVHCVRVRVVVGFFFFDGNENIKKSTWCSRGGFLWMNQTCKPIKKIHCSSLPWEFNAYIVFSITKRYFPPPGPAPLPKIIIIKATRILLD